VWTPDRKGTPTTANSPTYRQRLRRTRFPSGACPRAPDQKTGGQVAEEIALEQFVQVLPPGGKEWVQRHRPKTLAEAVTLTEDYMAAERPGGEDLPSYCPAFLLAGHLPGGTELLHVVPRMPANEPAEGRPGPPGTVASGGDPFRASGFRPGGSSRTEPDREPLHPSDGRLCHPIP
uniref:SCAN box domain-containing protein n=1 Tax=Pelusios castaneus TaxID=367368 RepID=A0A8C8RF79_9SAUR